MRTIAISDIHAHPDTFKKLLTDKVKLTTSDRLFLLGDYVHRGPSHAKVFDYIIELQKEGYQIRGLLGNHELIWKDEMRMHGSNPPQRHTTFLRSLKYVIEYQNFIFVHAGINFKATPPLSDTHSLAWIRNWYADIDYEWLNNRIIVHGHTAMREEEIRKRVNNREQVIGIDNGCFVDHIKGMGQLCALDLTNWELYFQKNIG